MSELSKCLSLVKTQLQGHRNNKIEAASILYLADLKVAKVSKKLSKNRDSSKEPDNHVFRAYLAKIQQTKIAVTKIKLSLQSRNRV